MRKRVMVVVVVLAVLIAGAVFWILNFSDGGFGRDRQGGPDPHRYEPLPDLASQMRAERPQSVNVDTAKQAVPLPGVDGVVLVHREGGSGFNAGRLRLCWAERWGSGPQWDVEPVAWKDGVRYLLPQDVWGRVCLIDLPDSGLVYSVIPGVLVGLDGRLAQVDEGDPLPSGAMPPSARRAESEGPSIANGKLARALKEVILESPGTPDGIPIERFGEIRAQVVDTEGTPLEGAAVRWGGTWGAPVVSGATKVGPATVTTDRAGMALLQKCKVGSHGMEATKSGYKQVRNSPSVTVKSGERTIDVQVVMEKGFELRGTVKNERGEPVANGSVKLLFRDPVNGWFNIVSGTIYVTRHVPTNELGEFSITGDAPLEVIHKWFESSGSLVLYASDHKGQTAFHDVSDVKVHQNITLATEVTGETHITVVDPDGNVLKGAKIAVKGMTQLLSGPNKAWSGLAEYEGVFEADESGLLIVRLPTFLGRGYVTLDGWTFPHYMILGTRSGLKSPDIRRVTAVRAGTLRVTCPAECEDWTVLAARILEDESREWHEGSVKVVNGVAELKDVLPGKWIVGLQSPNGELSQAEAVEFQAVEAMTVALHRPTGPPVAATGGDWSRRKGGAVFPWFGMPRTMVSQLSTEVSIRLNQRLWDKPADPKLAHSLMRVIDGTAPMIPASWPSWGLLLFSLELPEVVLPHQPYVAVPWPESKVDTASLGAPRGVPITVVVDDDVDTIPDYVHFIGSSHSERTRFAVVALRGLRKVHVGNLSSFEKWSHPDLHPMFSPMVSSSFGRGGVVKRPVATAVKQPDGIMIRIHWQ